MVLQVFCTWINFVFGHAQLGETLLSLGWGLAICGVRKLGREIRGLAGWLAG